MSQLAGRVAVVTGGTRGIGAAIAARMLAEGASVLVCGRTLPGQLPTGGGRTAEFVQADVREADQAAAVIEAAVGRLGRLDIAVNNAGGSPSADAATVSPRFVARVVALNLLAPFYVAQAANAVMQRQAAGGVIINIGSVAALNPAPGTAAYAAAKGGLTVLTRALALEFGPRVRVNQVTAGLVRTGTADDHYGGEDGRRAVAGLIPAGRMAVPDDIADACLLLASPLAGYVSGAELRVDGGGEVPGRVAVVRPLRLRERQRNRAHLRGDRPRRLRDPSRRSQDIADDPPRRRDRRGGPAADPAAVTLTSAMTTPAEIMIVVTFMLCERTSLMSDRRARSCSTLAGYFSTGTRASCTASSSLIRRRWNGSWRTCAPPSGTSSTIAG
jgi:NAD(P)-dependent dehydrogenase (short-subunit alcohol dehydrogenase family)